MGTLSQGLRNALLDAVFRAAPTVDYDEVWVQLHDGDPGSAGTSNIADNDTRMQATFGDAAASGAISNTVAIEWTASDDETYTHVSLWSDDETGDFLGSDDLNAPAPVLTGDTFRIPVGDLDVTIT